MKNKIFYAFLGFSIVTILTGCGKETDYSERLETKGKCVATECIKQIDITNTVEEINEIIGFEGELIDEEYNSYLWDLSENSELEATYYSSDEAYITIYVDEEVFKNDKVDFSKYEEIEELLDNGESLTYDEFVKKVGDEGILVEKTPYSTEYLWVNSDGGYLNATFQNSSGKCSFVSGWF